MLSDGPLPLEPLRKNRDFGALWGSLASLEFGTNLTFIATPLLALDILGPRPVGFVAAAGSLGSLTVLLVAGALTDRLPGRRIMQVSLGVRVFGLAAALALYFTDHLTTATFVGVAFILGVAGSAFRPAETAAVRRIVPEPQWPAAFSRNQVRSTAADMAGSAAGGFLYALDRFVPWFGDLICAAIALIGVSRIHHSLGHPPPRGSALADIRKGAHFVLRSPVLRTMLIVTLITNFASYWPAFVVMLRSDNISSPTIGLVGTGIGIAGLIGALVAEPLINRAPPRIVMSASLLAIGGLLLVLTLPLPAPALIAAVLTATMCTAPFGVSCAVIEARITPINLVGRVSALSRFCAMAAIPAGQALGTSWLRSGGPSLTFAAFSLPQLGAGLFLLLSSKFWRDLTQSQQAVTEETSLSNGGN